MLPLIFRWNDSFPQKYLATNNKWMESCQGKVLRRRKGRRRKSLALLLLLFFIRWLAILTQFHNYVLLERRCRSSRTSRTRLLLLPVRRPLMLLQGQLRSGQSRRRAPRTIHFFWPIEHVRETTSCGKQKEGSRLVFFFLRSFLRRTFCDGSDWDGSGGKLSLQLEAAEWNTLGNDFFVRPSPPIYSS